MNQVERPTTHYDAVIRNGTVVTMNSRDATLEGGMVAIRGENIAYVGVEEPGAWQADRVIDARAGLILPGLINAHTHAAMSLFRGLADDLPLMDWLNHYIFPVESRMDGDFVHSGALLACAEMILSGTTTFCDMYLFEDRVACAARTAGLRCLVGEVLYDFPSPNYGPIDKGFEYTAALIAKWQDDPLVSVAVEPHSLYTCSSDLLVHCGQMASDHKVPMVIHVSETLNEVAQIKAKYGRSPIGHLDDLGLLGPTLIADHCVHLDSSDMDRLAAAGVKVVHNPESNMKLASGIAPVVEMLARGITVGLGTDGCASNNNLDMFAEMDTAAKLHKVQTMDPTVMDARTVLRMATIEGAKALGMDSAIGSLETGKKADIVVVDVCRPHLVPMYHACSNLVYAARGNDVSHTIINGRMVMEDRRLLSLDLTDVMARARANARQVRAWLSASHSGS